MILLLLLLTLVTMSLALKHGLDEQRRLKIKTDLEQSHITLNRELEKFATPSNQDIERVTRHQRDRGIISFDEYLSQTTNQFPDNRDTLKRFPD